jgi:hypothetical protein
MSGEREETGSENVSPLNEISPPLFPLRALHPIFVQFNEIVVWRVGEFWKGFHGVFKNFVVNPGTERERERESNDEHFESCR